MDLFWVLYIPNSVFDPHIQTGLARSRVSLDRVLQRAFCCRLFGCLAVSAAVSCAGLETLFLWLRTAMKLPATLFSY